MTRPTLRIQVYPGLGLRGVETREGQLRVETVDLEALREELGADLLCGFLRLFVWVDRISSLIHLAYWSNQNLREDSCANSRNIQTVVWFASGALFEAADAIKQLDEAGVAARLSDDKHWRELSAMAARWVDKKGLLRRARNNIGFHADPLVMARGLEVAAASGKRFVILASDDQTTTRSSFRLGLEVLLNGMAMSLQQFGDAFKVISADHGRFRTLVEYVLLGVLQHCGAMPPGLPDDPPPSSPSDPA